MPLRKLQSSNSTTPMKGIVHDHVLEFCRAVSDRVAPQLINGNVQLLLDSIPELVQQFSQTVNFSGRDGEFNDLFYEIDETVLSESECSQISAALRNAISQSNREFVLKHDDNDWNQHARSLLEVQTCEVGIDEYGTDKPGFVPTSKLLGEIWESRAYTNLIDSLTHLLSTDQPPRDEGSGIWSIRAMFKPFLALYQMTASFHLPWVTTTLPIGNNKVCLIPAMAKIKDIPAFTMSSEGRIQLATTEHYLIQTWPSLGTCVIDRLQQFVDGDMFNFSTLMTQGKVIGEIIIKKDSELGIRVVITAPGTIVAQVAEQLAWMSATMAKNLSISGEFQYSSSAYESADSGWILNIKTSQIPAGPTLELLEQLRGQWGRSWIIWYTNIVLGFPTAYRPGDTPGLEISLPATNSRPTSLGHARNVYFQLDKSGKKDAVLWFGNAWWKLVSFSSPAFMYCHSYNCKCRPDLASYFGPDCDLSLLQHYRWILRLCPFSPTSAVDPRISLKQGRSRKSMRRLSGYLPKQVINYEPELQETSPAGFPSSEYTPVSSPPSPTDSFDTDLLSISDSCWMNEGEPEPISPFVQNILEQLLSEYSGEPRCSTRNNTELANGYLPSKANSIASGKEDGSTGQKRKAEHFTSENIGNAERPCKRQDVLDVKKIGFKSPDRLKLACHFWKFDPTQHRSCFMRKLDNISRLKQHLTRAHYKSCYCQRCFLCFENEETLRNHVEGPICNLREHGFRGRYMTNGQQEQVNRRSNTKHTETEKWYAIWDILFPEQDKPLSPYIDPLLSEDLSRFIDHARLNGPRLIADQVQQRGSTNSIEDDPRTMEQLIAHGLNYLIDRWLTNTQATTSERDTTPEAFNNLNSHGGTSELEETRPEVAETPQVEFSDNISSNTSQRREENRDEVEQKNVEEIVTLPDREPLGSEWTNIDLSFNHDMTGEHQLDLQEDVFSFWDPNFELPEWLPEELDFPDQHQNNDQLADVSSVPAQQQGEIRWRVEHPTTALRTGPTKTQAEKKRTGKQ
ncbi:hypothetical protein QBC38DRAFT_518214 [Podospora fimiseda]|uniref:C2H2-type domain-containing protein n=1 Tax=Podospora fimiseda TaxID=252190 RepID=A0AAN6YQP1_9PEZI|nr:hypothetical protein QBC38DRAFT_518214 [Podospora fimiseda]